MPRAGSAFFRRLYGVAAHARGNGRSHTGSRWSDSDPDCGALRGSGAVWRCWSDSDRDCGALRGSGAVGHAGVDGCRKCRGSDAHVNAGTSIRILEVNHVEVPVLRRKVRAAQNDDKSRCALRVGSSWHDTEAVDRVHRRDRTCPRCPVLQELPYCRMLLLVHPTGAAPIRPMRYEPYLVRVLHPACGEGEESVHRQVHPDPAAVGLQGECARLGYG